VADVCADYSVNGFTSWPPVLHSSMNHLPQVPSGRPWRFTGGQLAQELAQGTAGVPEFSDGVLRSTHVSTQIRVAVLDVSLRCGGDHCAVDQQHLCARPKVHLLTIVKTKWISAGDHAASMRERGAQDSAGGAMPNITDGQIDSWTCSKDRLYEPVGPHQPLKKQDLPVFLPEMFGIGSIPANHSTERPRVQDDAIATHSTTSPTASAEERPIQGAEPHNIQHPNAGEDRLQLRNPLQGAGAGGGQYRMTTTPTIQASLGHWLQDWLASFQGKEKMLQPHPNAWYMAWHLHLWKTLIVHLVLCEDCDFSRTSHRIAGNA